MTIEPGLICLLRPEIEGNECVCRNVVRVRPPTNLKTFR